MSSKLTWVAKPSTDVAKAIQLAEKSSGSILIAKTLGPLSFVLLEEDSYETHKVNLGELHSCECSTFQKTEEPCVHICWLLLRKFKVQPQDESEISRAFRFCNKGLHILSF
ncbi:hypothetical protein RvY_13604 [Ramazzottius varieornatus]|uniref:SWIM-type domain-containing protein n=1 Tax=Ramazzottius varieornatus TaxID=947166 RepID=A0A1D1VWZ7_RAMVA|nr:hypothetical protein RvY_13604 [Ramazzottius varieornatus]